MCDTLVALPPATSDGSTIFAKNSDREPNEAQAINLVPRREHPAGASLNCTYITIPQVRATNAVLLSQPFWMWGAEMGANEHGVVIGNEAIFSKVKVPAQGLTGMDLVRLGLERGDSASAALEVITGLLEKHGQGGSGGYRHPFFYHNSFLIADHREAWVLETIERHWAAQRVTDVRSISNGLTIGSDYDRASAELASYAVQRGWARSARDFDFSRDYSDLVLTQFSGCRVRQPQTMTALEATAGKLTPAAVMGILRSHGPGTGKNTWTPAQGSNGSVCMHYSDNLIRVNQTTASLVAHLRPDGAATYWLTGTAAPCLGVFKPFYLDAGLPDLGPEPGPAFDPCALWWQGERLHRAVLEDYRGRYPVVAADRDALEQRFLADEADARSAGPAARLAFSAECYQAAAAATTAWTEQALRTPITHPAPWLYRWHWRQQSEAAGLPG